MSTRILVLGAGFGDLELSTTLDAVRLPYATFVKPGVRLLRETIVDIDPAARRVTTDAGVHTCDSSWRLAPITTWRRRRDWRTPTSSIRSRAPTAFVTSCRASRKVTRSSAFAAHATNARLRRANARFSCTIS